MDTLDYILDKFNLRDWKKLPVEIPNFGRDELALLFEELGFKSGAEIGVKEGKYSEVLCKANPNLHLFSVDPWDVDSYFDHNQPHITGDGIPVDPAEFERYESSARNRLKNYNCSILKMRSMEAVKWIADNSLDFVYIDGNHEFKFCVEDIYEWSWKVRPGGIISGHDYTIYRSVAKIHVKKAVEAYTQSYNIKPWFVLGSEGEYPGVIRDPSRSWMWVKQ